MTVYVPVVSGKSKDEIELEACRITEKFYPNLLCRAGPFPVLDLFDHKLRINFGLDPGVEELSPGIEGITWPDGRVFLSEETYRGASEGNGRARFTVAHECYHGLYHRRQIQKALIDTGELVLHRRTDIKPYLDPEWQADTFASALLMPEKLVRIVVEHRSLMDRVNVLVTTFEVSQKAAQVRLRKLSIDFI